MFKRRDRADGLYPVAAEVDSDLPVGSEQLLDLIVASTEPVIDPPEGVSDRRRAAALAQVEWLGVDPAEFAAIYDLGHDYQFDHPMCHVDRTLDAAFVPEGMSQETIVAVAPVVEGLVANRLARYEKRAAARARMTSDPRLVGAAMRAHALGIAGRVGVDRRDDMVGLAPVTVVAHEFVDGDDPLGPLARLVQDEDAAFVRRFAARADVTLEAFGWVEVRAPHGIWIVPDR
ncbi:MAG: hypothetical protein OEM97_02120 [Acidimicrobiia bacterium]|nr:hypothetical protein [Acidimicrobiia bacterium]